MLFHLSTRSKNALHAIGMSDQVEVVRHQPEPHHVSVGSRGRRQEVERVASDVADVCPEGSCPPQSAASCPPRLRFPIGPAQAAPLDGPHVYVAAVTRSRLIASQVSWPARNRPSC